MIVESSGQAYSDRYGVMSANDGRVMLDSLVRVPNVGQNDGTSTSAQPKHRVDGMIMFRPRHCHVWTPPVLQGRN